MNRAPLFAYSSLFPDALHYLTGAPLPPSLRRVCWTDVPPAPPGRGIQEWVRKIWGALIRPTPRRSSPRHAAMSGSVSLAGEGRR